MSNYTHNDKIDSVITELESAKVYLDECIALLQRFKSGDMQHMSHWDSHLLLDKVHLVYRAVTRFPVINFVDIKAANEERTNNE